MLELHTQGMAFIPAFPWFERLTHTVLVEYLRRIIAPKLDEVRSERQAFKAAILETIANLPEAARASLKKLLDWSGRFLACAVMGPMAPNREWASDETEIECLRSAGLIDADAVSMDGKSWIKDREVAYTVFGPYRAAIFVGEMYLVLNSRESVLSMQRHFDGFIRVARINAHETSGFVAALAIG